jgi:hypothetical protein
MTPADRTAVVIAGEGSVMESPEIGWICAHGCGTRGARKMGEDLKCMLDCGHAPASVDDLFLIWCTDSHDLALWWRPGRCGYTVRIDQAGLYSGAEARAIAARRGIDLPIPLAKASSLARGVVIADEALADASVRAAFDKMREART